MTKNIVVRLEIDGTHNWPGVVDHEDLTEVHFLQYIHRHKWFITAKKEVYGDDRDIEFIVFKRNIEDYLRVNYYSKGTRTHEFGAKSCEMLAEEILREFDCNFVSVFEDNENGAECFK